MKCLLILTKTVFFFFLAEDFQCNEIYEHDAVIKGVLSSPFYGKRKEYHNGLECEYRIKAPEGYVRKHF